MEHPDLGVLLAVFLEMMGGVFWLLLVLGIATVVGLTVVLVLEKGLSSRRLVACEMIGVLGGFAALAIMAWVTVSGFTDAGGPVDWLLIAIIWGIGLVATTMMTYTLVGFYHLLTKGRHRVR